LADKKKRIHHLAKELLVKSSTIIEKCHAEGIEIKNHMHVVSAGMEATIREWFSEGAHTTTMEETQRVNLQKVRLKPKRKKKTKAALEAEVGAAVAVAEAPGEAPEVETLTNKKKKTKAPARQSPKQVAEKAAEAVTVVMPRPGETVETVTGTEEQVEPAAPSVLPFAPTEPGEEDRPSVAASAPEAPPAKPELPPELVIVGPQNIPKPAQLSGPKVIRVERPDFVEAPRPAARSTSQPAVRPPLAPIRSGEDEEPSDTPARGHGRGPGAVRGRRAGADAGAVPGKHAPPRRGPRDAREVVNEKYREWRDRDLIERRQRLDHVSGRGIGGLRAIEGKLPTRRARQGGGVAQVLVKKDKIEMTEPIVVKDLSREAGIPVSEIVKKLMEEGILAGIISTIDAEKAQLITADHGIELTVLKAKSGLDKLAEEFAALERPHLSPRPTVVTVLGHVDHGKTSLLDRIRQANVVEGEAGGITQHVGAYRVRVGDKWVTFLDTPGHAAFTAMRARGANLTDVVVLVVAADDGVMPTTIEAINHARAAETTIVVALNKIDLPHELNKLYGQLAGQGLTPTGEWGGETDVIRTSALTGEGVDDLLAHLATLSELMELRADPTIPAYGTVIEAERSGSLGSTARVLVQGGTLRPGNLIVCGGAYGKVRSLRGDQGHLLDEAGPSTPVEVTGLSEVPEAGDRFFVVDTPSRAKGIAAETAAQRRERGLTRVAVPTSLESVLASTAEGEIPELNVIIRADVQGSVDVLKRELTSFPNDQVKLNVLHAGVGVVTESDIVLAKASKAIIIAFHVVPDPAISKMAKDQGVDIRSYRVIYKVMDDIRKALEGLLTPDEKIELRGRAEVREIFSISRVGKIAGSYVRDGLISRSHMVRVVRDGVVVRDEGTVESLRRFKDDVKEVKSGFECGIRITDFNDLKPGDVIEAFEIVQVAKTLNV
jgi:translation initiation factor IF-2